MPIPLEQAHALVEEVQVPQVVHLFAQAQARHVLHEVNEQPENFPAFDANLTDKVTFAAYALLAAGCSVLEQASDRSQGSGAVERAASLLQYVHGPLATRERDSGFHVLLAAMGFYAAGQYSRAYVSIRPVEEQTSAGRIIAAFLRRDPHGSIAQLNDVLLRDPTSFDDVLDVDEWAITVAIGRAVSLALEFTWSGAFDLLAAADQQLRDASVVASTRNHSAWWWVIRLLRLMLSDLSGASPWRTLPPYFGASAAAASTLSRYTRLLAFSKPPVAELWSSQRAALPLALDPTNRGAVINLRTSAGKTRVAELAILQTLVADPAARIFYLAPFRSLAIEVEETLSRTFGRLGHSVSHLYGGARVSSVDTTLAAQSTITIATPEKARALLRAAPDLFASVKLVIVDEGHLIGPSERLVRNEVFVNHVKSVARVTGGRVLLLSAVLPNPQELAEWVTGDSSSVARSDWKPSAERFGLLRWNGSRVKIEWHGEFNSFNPKFIEARRLESGRRRKPFPDDKNEAIAATAVRLTAIGPVMIFTGRAVSVPPLARAVLTALGPEAPDHPWPQHELRVFEAVCQEELSPDAIEWIAARAGVICHSNRLPPQVRLALEHLIRAKPPKIIIATTTLAQGVNVGISSVIVATPYISDKTMEKRDFWNVCGRAGRAFVDGEGKILYAIDDTRKGWQIQKDELLARSYFRAVGGDRVESGLLFVVRRLATIARAAGVSFEVLLELVASNDFSPFGEAADSCHALCDLVDDELLALHTDPALNDAEEDPAIWVDRVFRESLAVIQARASSSEPNAEDVLEFLRVRSESVVNRVAPHARKAVVSSSLPLSIALRMHDTRTFFAELADSFVTDGRTQEALVTVVRAVEDWTRDNAIALFGALPSTAKLDALRQGWIAGVGLHSLAGDDKEANAICRDVYGYQLPWIIHAASQQLRDGMESDRPNVLAAIALTVEIGVPTEAAGRIFLAGVRSRAAATELAALDVSFGETVPIVAAQLRDDTLNRELRDQVSATTAAWLDLMFEEAARQRRADPPHFVPFVLSTVDQVDVLHARKFGGRLVLTTVDGGTRVEVESSERHPFEQVANDPRFAFVLRNGEWHLAIRDPRVTTG